MAFFYDTVTPVDYRVEDVLEKLEQHDLADDTIVFFWADHGSGYSRARTHAYDDGLRIPLIAGFPEKYQHLAPGLPGTVMDYLVMHMDLEPSTLSLAGIPGPEHSQGRVLFGPQKGQPRDVCMQRQRSSG